MQSSPRGESLHSSWRAFNACSEGNRHQPAPLLAYTLELGVFLTARAPNRRRWSPAFGGRDDAGPRSRNTGERKWTRPHCSSSSSWCCCSAAVDSSTDAGLESEGRLARRDQSSPNGRVHRSHGCRRSWRDRRPYTSRGLRSTHRSTPVRRVHRFLSGENRDIPRSAHASSRLVPPPWETGSRSRCPLVGIAPALPLVTCDRP